MQDKIEAAGTDSPSGGNRAFRSGLPKAGLATGKPDARRPGCPRGCGLDKRTDDEKPLSVFGRFKQESQYPRRIRTWEGNDDEID